jgi:peptidoglycan/xylan/chitin deacetylase (PgdA/CDA1 family)
MILTYHHVKLWSRNEQTVGLFQFIRQMLFIRNKKVVYLNDYDPNDVDQIVITFDDGYKDVLTFALPILRFFRYPFEVFIVADFYQAAETGNWLKRRDRNTIFLNKRNLQKIVKYGGRLQYHSKSHPYLDRIDDLQQLEQEIIVPENIKLLDNKGFQWFAYPYWRWNDKVMNIVKKHYKGARSGNGFEKNNENYALDSIFMKNILKKEVYPNQRSLDNE